MGEEPHTFTWQEREYAVNELNVRNTAALQRFMDACEKDEQGNLKFVDDIAKMVGIVMRGLGADVTDEALLDLPQSKLVDLSTHITTAMNAILQNGNVVAGEGKSDFLSEPAISSGAPTAGGQGKSTT